MPAIWRYPVTPAQLDEMSKHTLIEHLSITFTEIGDDYLKARMPVDERTFRPGAALHGGASVALAESLGSTAANLCVDFQQKLCVGLEINANHIRTITGGAVYGIARPLHLGGSTHVWDIRIYSEGDDRLVCVSRLTMAVLDQGARG